jgi:hypothetical protein
MCHVIHPPVPVVYCGYKSNRIEANLTADVLGSVRNHFPKKEAQIWHFDQYFRHRVCLFEINCFVARRVMRRLIELNLITQNCSLDLA